MDHHDRLLEFHAAFDLPVAQNPEMPAIDVRERLWTMIQEEVDELKEAFLRGDHVEVADALGDITYLAYHAATICGIPLDACVAEIHDSNMTKLGEDGAPIRRADGKILKGPNYRPPNLARVLGL